MFFVFKKKKNNYKIYFLYSFLMKNKKQFANKDYISIS